MAIQYLQKIHIMLCGNLLWLFPSSFCRNPHYSHLDLLRCSHPYCSQYCVPCLKMKMQSEIHFAIDWLSKEYYAIVHHLWVSVLVRCCWNAATPSFEIFVIKVSQSTWSFLIFRIRRPCLFTFTILWKKLVLLYHSFIHFKFNFCFKNVPKFLIYHLSWIELGISSFYLTFNGHFHILVQPNALHPPSARLSMRHVQKPLCSIL